MNALTSADRIRRDRKRAMHDMKVEIIALRKYQDDAKLVIKRVLKNLTSAQRELWPADLIRKMEMMK